MVPRIGIVADDLTGANDACGRLAARGWKAWASVGARMPAGKWDAVAFDSRSRFLDRAGARAASRNTWKKMLGGVFDPRFFFQKIDSTLRGHPSAEIEGMLDAAPARWVAVVPAYPSMGRVTRGGVHWVDGKPLRRSEYARDPLSPPESFRVDRLFQPRHASHLRLKSIAAGPAALARTLADRLKDPSVRFLSFDAETDRDLKCIVAACLALDCRAWAGASGLAAALADLLPSRRAAPPQPPRLARAMVLAGSLSLTTLSQVRVASASGLGPWESIEQGSRRKAWPARSRAYFLTSVPDRTQADSLRRAAAGAPVDSRTWADKAMKRLAVAGGRLAPRTGIIILTGGHTLETFYALRGYTGNRILGDLLPGLPYGQASGPGRAKQWVASKPGGFGRPSDLKTALNSILRGGDAV